MKLSLADLDQKSITHEITNFIADSTVLIEGFFFADGYLSELREIVEANEKQLRFR